MSAPDAAPVSIHIYGHALLAASFRERERRHSLFRCSMIRYAIAYFFIAFALSGDDAEVRDMLRAALYIQKDSFVCLFRYLYATPYC